MCSLKLVNGSSQRKQTWKHQTNSKAHFPGKQLIKMAVLMKQNPFCEMSTHQARGFAKVQICFAQPNTPIFKLLAVHTPTDNTIFMHFKTLTFTQTNVFLTLHSWLKLGCSNDNDNVNPASIDQRVGRVWRNDTNALLGSLSETERKTSSFLQKLQPNVIVGSSTLCGPYSLNVSAQWTPFCTGTGNVHWASDRRLHLHAWLATDKSSVAQLFSPTFS